MTQHLRVTSQPFTTGCGLEILGPGPRWIREKDCTYEAELVACPQCLEAMAAQVEHSLHTTPLGHAILDHYNSKAKQRG